MNFTFWKCEKDAGINRTQPIFGLLLWRYLMFNPVNQNAKGDLRGALPARLRGLNLRFDQLATETLDQTHDQGMTGTYSTWTSKRITRVVLTTTRRIAPSE